MYVRKEIGLNASKVLSTKTRKDLKSATCCCLCVWPSSASYLPWGDGSCPAMSSVLLKVLILSLIGLSSSPTPHPSSLNKFQNYLHLPSSFPSSSRLFLHTLAYFILYTPVGFSSLQERLSSRLLLYQLQALFTTHTMFSWGEIAFSSALLSYLASESQLP